MGQKPPARGKRVSAFETPKLLFVNSQPGCLVFFGVFDRGKLTKLVFSDGGVKLATRSLDILFFETKETPPEPLSCCHGPSQGIDDSGLFWFTAPSGGR